MSYPPINDPNFLGTLEQWFGAQLEILAFIRYSHSGGSKDIEFFSSLQSFTDRLFSLPPLTCVIAFKKPQLSLRGVVDDRFIATCLSNIPDGSEYLLVEGEKRIYGQASWFHHSAGDSHEELREALEESRGVPVAVGLYPPWLADTEDVISAIVPDKQGTVRVGTY